MATKLYHTIVFLLLIPLTLVSQEINKEDLLQAWANNLEYNLEVAERMPDSLYDYKPTEVQMTFKEQILHMANHVGWISHDYLGADSLHIRQPIQDISNAEAIAILKTAYANATNAIKQMDAESWKREQNFFAGPMSGQQFVHLLFDHQTHHRAKLLVYLRLNGIEPPRYRGW